MGKLNLAAIKEQSGISASAKIHKDGSMDVQTAVNPNTQGKTETGKSVEKRWDGKQVNRAEDAQIVLRTTSSVRKQLKRWALEEEKTVKDLVLEGLKALRKERGLPALSED